jgi:hypothetical protein
MSKVLLVLLYVATAWAADIDGEWKLTYTTTNGKQRESILDVKADGGRLTGKITSDRGTAIIDEGTIDRDQIAFSLLRKGNGDEIRVEYKGRIENGVLKLSMHFGKREPVTVLGRRL